MCLIKLIQLWKSLLTVQYFKRLEDEVNVFFLGYGSMHGSHICTLALLLRLFFPPSFCSMFGVLSLGSEYLMKPWRALQCCSSGHGVSEKALSLWSGHLFESIRGLKTPQPPFGALASWRLKVTPLCVPASPAHHQQG